MALAEKGPAWAPLSPRLPITSHGPRRDGEVLGGRGAEGAVDALGQRLQREARNY